MLLQDGDLLVKTDQRAFMATTILFIYTYTIYIVYLYIYTILYYNYMLFIIHIIVHNDHTI